jgi:hypothetical protein
MPSFVHIPRIILPAGVCLLVHEHATRQQLTRPSCRIVRMRACRARQPKHRSAGQHGYRSPRGVLRHRAPGCTHDRSCQMPANGSPEPRIHHPAIRKHMHHRVVMFPLLQRSCALICILSIQDGWYDAIDNRRQHNHFGETNLCTTLQMCETIDTPGANDRQSDRPDQADDRATVGLARCTEQSAQPAGGCRTSAATMDTHEMARHARVTDHGSSLHTIHRQVLRARNPMTGRLMGLYPLRAHAVGGTPWPRVPHDRH